jgi:predicted RNA-binding Zn-ribbon protein involved in translation (DUF1610 family)
MTQYRDSKFFCPKCGIAVMQRREHGTTVLYCPDCDEEMLVICRPRFEENEASSIITMH